LHPGQYHYGEGPPPADDLVLGPENAEVRAKAIEYFSKAAAAGKEGFREDGWWLVVVVLVLVLIIVVVVVVVVVVVLVVVVVGEVAAC